MKNSYFLLILLSVIVIALHNLKPEDVKYPDSKKELIVDSYFDTTIVDPYRWLEDESSRQTKSWVVRQNSVTDSYMKRIRGVRKIKNRLKEIWNYPYKSIPFLKGDDRIYYFSNSGLQNQSVLYSHNIYGGELNIVLDPNKLSLDGTVSLSGLYFSNNKKYMGYGLNRSGSDWQEFYIMDINSGETMSDQLKWIKFSGMSWNGDGFYYSRMPKPENEKKLTELNNHSKIYYHEIGTLQEEDDLIYYDPENPFIMASVYATTDEKYIFLYRYKGTYGNSLSFSIADNSNIKWTPIVKDMNSEISVIDHINGSIYALTDRDAPFKKIVLIDTRFPLEKNWESLVEGNEDEVLESANIVGGYLFVHFTKDVISIWKIYDLKGNYIRTIELPGKGIVSGFNGKIDQTRTWYSFNNLVTPSTIYEYDILSNNSEVYTPSESKFLSDEYILKQEFYDSKDGKMVPIFIAHKKNIDLDNRRPTLLYGYGGFNISIKPAFQKQNTIILENNGVFAIANIRGGGEYGEKWHRDGMLLNKQNVFDDFIYAAQYLFKKGYTDNNHLAIRGGSNGGLLIGAVLNQYPGICKVAFPEVGVMDMLRYEKFTIGYAWATEYGSVNDSEHFYNLLSYSPIHNIDNNGRYPSTLIYTADHDDRVVPAHSFKYAATLQSAQAGDDPILIRIGKKTGHGSGKSTEKIINEYAEKWGFMFYEMGLKFD